MATPTNLPAAVATGDVGTAAQFNNLRVAFRILQVVYGFTQTGASSASTTYVDTTLSATITPQSTSSKILCIISQNGYNVGSNCGLGIQLVRNGTGLVTWSDLNFANQTVIQHSFTVLDSPASTSALTYKTQMARSSGGGTVYTQVNSNLATITLMEVSA